jgi:hypothetical protein
MDEGHASNCRRGLRLAQIHSDPSANDGDSHPAAADAVPAWDAGVAVRASMAFLRLRTFGRRGAGSPRAGIRLTSRDIDVSQNLLEVHVRLRARHVFVRWRQHMNDRLATVRVEGAWGARSEGYPIRVKLPTEAKFRPSVRAASRAGNVRKSRRRRSNFSTILPSGISS